MAVRLMEDLSQYLSACQLGITLASLAIGFLGEPAIAELLEPVFGDFLAHGPAFAISIGIAYVLTTSLHITAGEQIPKIYAIVKPEPIALRVARPLYLFAKAMRPFIAALNGDRKSTRLNSSHANISYAVFCLKKKKTNYRLPSS